MNLMLCKIVEGGNLFLFLNEHLNFKDDRLNQHRQQVGTFFSIGSFESSANILNDLPSFHLPKILQKDSNILVQSKRKLIRLFT